MFRDWQDAFLRHVCCFFWDLSEMFSSVDWDMFNTVGTRFQDLLDCIFNSFCMFSNTCWDAVCTYLKIFLYTIYKYIASLLNMDGHVLIVCVCACCIIAFCRSVCIFNAVSHFLFRIVKLLWLSFCRSVGHVCGDCFQMSWYFLKTLCEIASRRCGHLCFSWKCFQGVVPVVTYFKSGLDTFELF